MENKVAGGGYGPGYVLKAKDWMIGLLLAVGAVLASVLAALALSNVVPPNMGNVVGVVASGFGSLALFALYCYVTDRSWSFVDVPDLSVRAIGIGVVLGAVLTVVQASLTAMFLSQGVGEPVGPVGRMIQARGLGFLLVIALLNLVLIAPAEELLYRNGIQKLLYRSHTTPFAVLGSSLIFALPHSLNFLMASSVAMLIGLVEIMINGMGYGLAYAYWRRVDVTIVAHGVYNCAVFVVAYFHVFGP